MRLTSVPQQKAFVTGSGHAQTWSGYRANSLLLALISWGAFYNSTTPLHPLTRKDHTAPAPSTR